jgi:hypothetical protein
MKYARILNGKVVETFNVDPGKDIFEYFVPAIASQFVICPDDVEPDDNYDGESFTPGGIPGEPVVAEEPTEETPAE